MEDHLNMTVTKGIGGKGVLVNDACELDSTEGKFKKNTCRTIVSKALDENYVLLLRLLLCTSTVILNHTHKWVVALQPGAGAIGTLGSVPIDT